MLFFAFAQPIDYDGGDIKQFRRRNHKLQLSSSLRIRSNKTYVKHTDCWIIITHQVYTWYMHYRYCTPIGRFDRFYYRHRTPIGRFDRYMEDTTGATKRRVVIGCHQIPQFTGVLSREVRMNVHARLIAPAVIHTYLHVPCVSVTAVLSRASAQPSSCGVVHWGTAELHYYRTPK